MAKTFKERMQKKAVNPTLQFITPPEAEADPQPVEEAAPRSEAITAAVKHKAYQAKRAHPQYDEEIKSRRLQLIMTPSLYEAVRERAAEERMSVNEFITQAVKATLGK